MSNKSWSERIPAMIAKGKEHVDSEFHNVDCVVNTCAWGITAGEVALATTLWALLVHESRRGRDYMVDEPPIPLRNFAEKMEKCE